jgi:hypothetical protein
MRLGHYLLDHWHSRKVSLRYIPPPTSCDSKPGMGKRLDSNDSRHHLCDESTSQAVVIYRSPIGEHHDKTAVVSTPFYSHHQNATRTASV